MIYKEELNMFNNRPIFTTYLSNIKNLDLSKYYPVFVARHWPRGKPLFASMPDLAPTSELLSLYKQDKINIEEYIKIYNTQLEELDVIDIVTRLHKYNCDRYVVLVCYEPPNKFCHRHLISAWLRKHEYISHELI